MFRDAFHLTEPYRPKLSGMFAETLQRACIERPARVARARPRRGNLIRSARPTPCMAAMASPQLALARAAGNQR